MTLLKVQIGDGEAVAPTLPNLINAAAATHGAREYLTLNERHLTFRDAERISADWAKGLLAMGIGKASRVGLLMPNNPDWVLAFFAGARVGALTVTFSTFYQAPEISWGIRHNDIDTLLISRKFLSADYIERLERALPGLASHTSTDIHIPSHPYLRRIVVWGDCDRPWALKGPDALCEAAAAKPQIDDNFLLQVESNIAPADSLVIICTSGSTAEPKAVVHTHGTSVRVVYLFTHYIDVRPDDRTYTGQPFFWIGGLNMTLIPSLFMGSCICFADTPSPDDIAEMVVRERVTRLAMWPAQTSALLDHARSTGKKFDSVRMGIGAPRDERGEVIPKDHRAAGHMGMTESFGMHSIEKVTLAAPPGKAGNWERHLPGVERRAVDPKTRRELPPGEAGEVLIRGHSLMQGYYKREREETFQPDGFFATGDLGSIDQDDFIYFQGRDSEMVKTSGANVSPREVELALLGVKGVREGIVFGIDDPVKGEIVVAYIVPADGFSPDAEKICLALRSEISSYKVPQQIKFISDDKIPRTGSLKPRKPELKKMFLERLQAEDLRKAGE